MSDRKPSEIIQDFLDLLDRSHDIFFEHEKFVNKVNSMSLEKIHELEDLDNRNERNRFATEWKNLLQERRKHKDEMARWRTIHVFSSDNCNKAFIKKIRQMLQEQVKQEEYISVPPKEREYKGSKK